VSRLGGRVRSLRPRTLPCRATPGAPLPDDPGCVARELAIAAALTRGPAPLPAGEPAHRPAHVDPTRPTTATAAFPGSVVPGDIPA
jgi:hypothetical protein